MSIFWGTEAEEMASAPVQKMLCFFLSLLGWVFCLKVCVCTMCLLGAHGSGERLGYPGAGICTLLGAAILELGVQ